MKKLAAFVLMSLLGLSLQTAFAQEKSAMPKGLRGEMIANASGVESKILDLVKAMPQDKFSWRPEDGVRSVSEVYLHIAGANYLFPTFAGTKPPTDVDLKNLEKSTTDKATIAEAVKKSFDWFRGCISKLSDEDLDKTTKLFGTETSYRNVYLIALTHMHEHLGQSIAYSRTNHVVPPWTAAAEAKAKAEKPKSGM